MLQSKDKTICSKEHIHIAGFLLSSLTFAPTLSPSFMDIKRYHTFVPRKAGIYNFIQSTFLQKKSLHTNPIVFFFLLLFLFFLNRYYFELENSSLLKPTS